MSGVVQVPARGGDLSVHELGMGPAAAPAVVALHSISSNGLAWVPVARALGPDVRVLAPDMRGRAESADLRSTGLADHVDDTIRVLDHFALDQVVLVGHSMGAFAAALTAATHPDRVRAVVLVDGGLGLTDTGSFEVDDVLHSVIGPAMDRLSMTFDDAAAYLAHWRAHPTMGPLLDSPAGGDVTAYLLHDLTGEPGRMRSTSSLECVRADWADLMTDPATLAAVHTLQCPGHLFWAARGPLGQPTGLYDEERIAGAHLPDDLRTTRLGTDHYGAVLEAASVATVAAALREQLGLTTLPVPPSGRPIHTSVK